MLYIIEMLKITWLFLFCLHQKQHIDPLKISMIGDCYFFFLCCFQSNIKDLYWSRKIWTNLYGGNFWKCLNHMFRYATFIIFACLYCYINDDLVGDYSVSMEEILSVGILLISKYILQIIYVKQSPYDEKEEMNKFQVWKNHEISKLLSMEFDGHKGLVMIVYDYIDIH